MTTVEVAVADMEALRVLCVLGMAGVGVLWWIMERLASAPPEPPRGVPKPAFCKLHSRTVDLCRDMHSPEP